MASINRSGIVAGGAVAGLILAAGGVVLANFVILPELARVTPEGHSPDLAAPLLSRIGLGFLLVWIYAGFRPRFGAGRRSMIAAAVAIWAVTSAVVISAAALYPILPPLTVALVVVWGLIEFCLASFAGGYLYRRRAAEHTRRRGRGLEAMEV